MNQPIDLPELVDARTAAGLLGVRLRTLYAYASRGKLRSLPSPEGGKRDRRYVREDLLALKARADSRSGHGPVAAAALHWGEPVLESSITQLTGAGPVYRGYPAVELAKAGAPFEAVAELLWTGSLPAIAPRLGPSSRLARSRAWRKLQHPSAHPFLRLSLAVPIAAGRDEHRLGGQGEAERSRARGLLRHMIESLARPEARLPSAGSVEPFDAAAALTVALGGAPSKGAAAINAALVLCADHELNASTFTARMAASTGADLYACVAAGLGTLSGPKHGGACDRVEALVAEVGSPDEARAVVRARHLRGEEVPGFGHPIYRAGDPRTPPLLEAAQALAPRSRTVRVVLALAEAMRKAGGDPPTVDYGLVALTHALRLPAGSASAIFAIGRSAGWIAHVLEQRASGAMIRPRARFVGDGGPEPLGLTAAAR